MTIKKEILERVDSGITGYNDLLNGGYFKKTVNVVSGNQGLAKLCLAPNFYIMASKTMKKPFVL